MSNDCSVISEFQCASEKAKALGFTLRVFSDVVYLEIPCRAQIRFYSMEALHSYLNGFEAGKSAGRVEVMKENPAPELKDTSALFAELQAVKENAIRMAQDHRNHCDQGCNINLHLLRRALELAGISLNDKEKRAFM